MKNQWHVFEDAFRPVFLFIAIGTVVVGYFLTLVDEGFDVDSAAGAWIFWIAWGIPWATVSTLLAVRYFKITITPEGIRGYNFWGKYSFLRWQQITLAKPINLLGLRYVRLITGYGRLPMWVPLFLKNFDEFRQLVVGFAPEDNPFREFLVTKRRKGHEGKLITLCG